MKGFGKMKSKFITLLGGALSLGLVTIRVCRGHGRQGNAAGRLWRRRLYNWTGFYVGGNIGRLGIETRNPFVSCVDPGGAVGFGGYYAAGGNVFPNLNPAGVIGGGQIGYSWQMNQLVLGARG